MMLIFDKLTKPTDVLSSDFYSVALEDKVVKDCCRAEIPMEVYLYVPMDDGPNPSHYEHIETEQIRQEALLRLPQLDPERDMRQQQFGSTELVCYRAPAGAHSFRIMLPDTLIDQSIKRYHKVLQHVGMEKLYPTMSRRFYAPVLKAKIQEAIKNCGNSQQFKATGIGYGHLAVRETNVAPRFKIAVNTIGPWGKMQRGNNVCKFYALTMIDTVTNSSELMRVPNTTARAAAEAFEAGWLLRYPRPVWLIHDQETEFMGKDFQALLRQRGIRDTLIGEQNPQANAICEQMHQVVGNILWTTLHTNPLQNKANARN